MLRRLLVVFIVLLLHSGNSFAAHPLITDDTGTQGKGKFQIEAAYEFAHEESGGVTEQAHQIEAVLSYGIIDSVDVMIGIPYQFLRAEAGGVTVDEDGFSDLGLEVKWRFWECQGTSFAIKPGISFPTGNDDRGLGTGKVVGSLFLIATQEIEPMVFHFNAGYIRNENSFDERENIWHVSAAAEYGAAEWITLVGNIGMEGNAERGEDTPAAFILGGLILPVNEDLELSLGVKAGLTRPEADIAATTGITYRF